MAATIIIPEVFTEDFLINDLKIIGLLIIAKQLFVIKIHEILTQA